MAMRYASGRWIWMTFVVLGILIGSSTGCRSGGGWGAPSWMRWGSSAPPTDKQLAISKPSTTPPTPASHATPTAIGGSGAGLASANSPAGNSPAASGYSRTGPGAATASGGYPTALRTASAPPNSSAPAGDAQTPLYPTTDKAFAYPAQPASATSPAGGASTSVAPAGGYQTGGPYAMSNSGDAGGVYGDPNGSPAETPADGATTTAPPADAPSTSPPVATGGAYQPLPGNSYNLNNSRSAELPAYPADAGATAAPGAASPGASLRTSAPASRSTLPAALSTDTGSYRPGSTAGRGLGDGAISNARADQPAGGPNPSTSAPAGSGPVYGNRYTR